MRGLDDIFSVFSLDINSVHSSSIPGQFEHILHAKRVGIIRNDLLSLLAFTASSSLRKIPIVFHFFNRFSPSLLRSSVALLASNGKFS